MTDINRRIALGALAAGGALAATGAARAATAELAFKDLKKEAPISCLYHCDFGDPKRFDAMLRNMNNHLEVYGFDPFQIKLVTVSHGPGVQYFLKDLAGTPWADAKLPDDIPDRIAGLAKYGVEHYLCKITFARLKIPHDKIREADFVKLVPSGVATVGDLQSKGFSYLKSG
jgi:hypothetical protein